MKNVFALCLTVAFLGIGILVQGHQPIPTATEEKGVFTDLNEDYYYCSALFNRNYHRLYLFCDGEEIVEQTFREDTETRHNEQARTSIIAMLIRESKMKFLGCSRSHTEYAYSPIIERCEFATTR